MNSLYSLYKDVRDATGYIVGERAKGALRMSRLVQIAEDAGLEVEWHLEEDSSLWQYGMVGDWITEEQWWKGVDSGRFEVYCAIVKDDRGDYLASLGGIIIDGNRPCKETEDYKRGFEFELLSEAAEALMRGAD